MGDRAPHFSSRFPAGIKAQAKLVGLAKGGQPHQKKATGLKINPVATLAEAGISKNLADRARKLGKLSDEQFETKVKEWREDGVLLNLLDARRCFLEFTLQRGARDARPPF